MGQVCVDLLEVWKPLETSGIGITGHAVSKKKKGKNIQLCVRLRASLEDTGSFT